MSVNMPHVVYVCLEYTRCIRQCLLLLCDCNIKAKPTPTHSDRVQPQALCGEIYDPQCGQNAFFVAVVGRFKITYFSGYFNIYIVHFVVVIIFCCKLFVYFRLVKFAISVG